MALLITTDNPKRLLQLFKEAIDDGDVKLWQYDEDGDFHYKAKQWENEAYFTSRMNDSQLRFLLKKKENRVKHWRYSYAIYHGRLMEEFLSHFSDYCSQVAATAKPLP